MNTYQILTVSFGSGLLVTVIKFLYSRIKQTEKKTESVQLGVQALLRDRLYQTYLHHSEKGYAPIYARENFENMYQQYHILGANGVMDDIYHKFMNLPTERVNDDEGMV